MLNLLQVQRLLLLLSTLVFCLQLLLLLVPDLLLPLLAHQLLLLPELLSDVQDTGGTNPGGPM